MKSRLISLSVAVVIALIAGSFDPTVGQQSQERVIKRMPVEKNEPLEIVATKVNGEIITFGQKFTANDEWLKTLIFTVKNASNKRILFASIELFFPRAEGSKPMFDVFYGNWQLRSRPPQQGEHLVGVAAGDTVDIGFSDQRFAGLTRFLNDGNLGQNITKVDVRIGGVIFEDDTMWSRSEYLRRDPSNPRRWNNSGL
jgi:hypothetical protein